MLWINELSERLIHFVSKEVKTIAKAMSIMISNVMIQVSAAPPLSCTKCIIVLYNPILGTKGIIAGTVFNLFKYPPIVIE